MSHPKPSLTGIFQCTITSEYDVCILILNWNLPFLARPACVPPSPCPQDAPALNSSHGTDMITPHGCSRDYLHFTAAYYSSIYYTGHFRSTTHHDHPFEFQFRGTFLRKPDHLPTRTPSSPPLRPHLESCPSSWSSSTRTSSSPTPTASRLHFFHFHRVALSFTITAHKKV